MSFGGTDWLALPPELPLESELPTGPHAAQLYCTAPAGTPPGREAIGHVGRVEQLPGARERRGALRLPLLDRLIEPPDGEAWPLAAGEPGRTLLAEGLTAFCGVLGRPGEEAEAPLVVRIRIEFQQDRAVHRQFPGRVRLRRAVGEFMNERC